VKGQDEMIYKEVREPWEIKREKIKADKFEIKEKERQEKLKIEKAARAEKRRLEREY
jgi:hypothetical protein